jgi:nitroimidazol reductase NimA-like FMN-containing flavoprotein (pyridoxamine 5'-phosphate oxidase superfamily)
MMSLDADHPVAELSVDECWELLDAEEFGGLAYRLVDEVHIVPINYVVDAGTLLFRTTAGNKLLAAALHSDVAFEIDWYDDRSAWSVVVRGCLRRLGMTSGTAWTRCRRNRGCRRQSQRSWSSPPRRSPGAASFCNAPAAPRPAEPAWSLSCGRSGCPAARAGANWAPPTPPGRSAGAARGAAPDGPGTRRAAPRRRARCPSPWAAADRRARR